MKKQARQVFSIKAKRPNMAWAETILGEFLPPHPNTPHKYGQPNPALDADLIPPGEYCQYPMNTERATEHVSWFFGPGR